MIKRVYGNNFHILIYEREDINTCFIIVLDEDYRIGKYSEIKRSLEEILDGKKFDRILYIHELQAMDTYILSHKGVIEALMKHGKVFDEIYHPIPPDYRKNIHERVEKYVGRKEIQKGGLVVFFYGAAHELELLAIAERVEYREIKENKTKTWLLV